MNKIKLFKNRPLALTMLSLVVMTFITTVFQSCSKDEILVSESKQLEYLDMDVSNLQNATAEQNQIFNKAKARIDSYVILKNKRFNLTINSGNEIQMSERLFNFFQETIKQTNSIIKDLNVIEKDSKVLHVVKKTNTSGNVRFKIDNPENIPLNSTDYDVTWSGVNIYISSHTLNQLALGTVTIGTVCAMLPEPIISKVSAGIIGLTAAAAGYTAAECPNGIVVQIPWIGFNQYGIQE